MNESDNYLNRIFTRNLLSSLVEIDGNKEFQSILRRYIKPDFKGTYADAFGEIYSYMDLNYRNEYYYKNTLFNKLLLGKYSLNTSSAVTEIPIAFSKADFIIANKVGSVYEIKTELDTLERLEYQIEDYYKAFGYVWVVTCEKHYYKLYKLLKNTNVGILILTKRNTLSKRKEANFDCSSLDYESMFKILRKEEYENIILSDYGHLPVTKDFDYYDSCYKLIKRLDLYEFQSKVVNQIKMRKNTPFNEFQSQIPYELKSLFYFSKFSKKKYNELLLLLNERVGGD